MDHKVEVRVNFNHLSSMTNVTNFSDFIFLAKKESEIYKESWMNDETSKPFEERFKITKLQFNKITGKLELVEYTECEYEYY